MKKFSWTPERVETLTKGWQSGKSASEIAKSLGDEVTRNAVIGKVHRLGLSGDRTEPGKSTAKKEKPVVVPKVPEKQQEPVKIGEASSLKAGKKASKKNNKKITIMELTDRICKWPFGDPREPNFHFCGKPARTVIPYCEDHIVLAFQPPTRRDESPKSYPGFNGKK